MEKDNKKESPKTKGTKKFAPRRGDTRESSNEKIHWNDWTWYAASERLLKDAASFPFARPLGTINTLDFYAKDYTTQRFYAKDSLPGIFAINYISTIGISANDASNVNVASRQIYSYIRHANSGHANYEAPDLMMYLVAMGEIYGWVATLDRVYGTCRYYSQMNRFTGKALVEAMGFDFDRIISELADFRQLINVTKKRISALCVPKTMSYFARRYYLNSYIFKDSPSDRAQLYLFRQTDLYQLKATALSTGTSLFRFNLDDQLDLGSVKSLTDELLEPLLSDEDFNIMSGDILKAFGKEGCWSLAETPDTFVVIPEYNEEILDQIHNATQMSLDIRTTVPSSSEAYSPYGYRGIVHQQDGSIRNYEFTKSPSTGNFGGHMDIMLDLDEGHTEPKNVMVSTRLSNISTHQVWDAGIDEQTGFAATGTEIVTGYAIYAYVAGSGLNRFNFNGLQINNNELENNPEEYTGELYRQLYIVTLLSAFHKHPGIPVSEYDGDNTDMTYLGELKEIEDYTIIKPKDLQDLHEIATLSLFSIPSLT